MVDYLLILFCFLNKFLLPKNTFGRLSRFERGKVVEVTAVIQVEFCHHLVADWGYLDFCHKIEKETEKAKGYGH